MTEKEKKIENEFNGLVKALNTEEYWQFVREVLTKKQINEILNDQDVKFKEKKIHNLEMIISYQNRKEIVINILKNDIKDIQQRLIQNIIKTDQLKFNIEQRKKIRDIRSLLKDNMATLKLIEESDGILNENDKL